jgi:hypothetical protein
MRVYIVAVDEAEARRLAWVDVGLHHSIGTAQREAAAFNTVPGMIRRRQVFMVEVEFKVKSVEVVQP